MKEMTPNELIEYSNNSKCILIDVRTEREWETVGKPDGDQIGLKTYFVSIKNNEGSLNGNFVNDILSLNIEKEFEIKVYEKLGFSKCKVSIAVPNNTEFSSVQDLNKLKIATSYPNTLKKFLDKESIDANIHVINGSVEIAPNIGLSDAICDLVSSGSTLYKNNLKEVFVLHNSEAVLAGTSVVEYEKKDLLDKFLFRIKAVLKAQESKYILLNVPNDKIYAISKILPVLKSPTVLPLKKEGWSSLHSVINDDTFWDVIDKIKDAGAEDILVCPIEKMVL